MIYNKSCLCVKHIAVLPLISRTAIVYIPQNNIYEKKEFSKLQIQFEFIKIFKIVVPFSIETSLYLAAFFFFLLYLFKYFWRKLNSFYTIIAR